MARRLNKAATVYARTLLELAASKGQVEALREDFSALDEVFAKTPGLERALTLPMLSAEKKAALLAPLSGAASDLLKRLLKLLEAKGRLGLLPAIGETFLRLEEERRQVKRARVVSAVPLSKEQLDALAKRLSARSAGKTYLLQNEVDASLIAGFRVEEDGFVTDTSLRHKLEGLRQRLAAA
jgi:F-type H+-transporting ATPase subunit delta